MSIGNKTRYMLFIGVLAALVLVGAAYFWKHVSLLSDDTMVLASVLRAQLVTDERKPLDMEDFSDRYVLIYFGFTHCPDICPLDIEKLTNVLNALGREGENIVPVFITLDPERDTSETLHSYLQHFSPRWKGLTGTKEAVAHVAGAFRIAYEQQADSIFHSGYAFFMDKNGNNLAIFPHERTEAEIEKTLKEKMR